MFRNLLMSSAAYAPDDGTGADTGADTTVDANQPDKAADGKTLLSGQDDGKTDEQKAEEARVAARKAELDAMSPEDRGKAEAEDKAKEEAAAAEAKLKEVPEDGKYEFTLPDGMAIDEKLAAEAGPILKEAGVSRAGANKIAELFINHKKAEAEQWAKTQAKWVDDAKADKEYGGDKFDASLGSAKKALDKFGSPELRDALEYSGMGNHPELIRLLARVGNAFSDDKPVGSETPAAKGKSAEEELYGATTPLTRGK